MSLYHPLGPGEHRVSQRFGENPEMYAGYGLAGHNGIDFGVCVGTPVYAAHDGFAWPAEGADYGKQIRVYGNPYTSICAHLDIMELPESGRPVAAGELLGYSGNTGHSTAAHLHFGLKVVGEYVEGFRGWVDPEPYLMQEERMTQLWMQCQGHGYDPWVVDHARKFGGVKLMNPQYGNWRLFRDAGVTMMGRMIWPNDSDKAHIQNGARGAEAWWGDFWPTACQMPDIVLWEGPNEPDMESEAQAVALNDFETRLATLMYDNGKRLVGLSNGTGRPADLSLWRFFGSSLAAISYWGRHSYSLGEPWFHYDDRDHAFRLVRDVKAIRDLGFRVPPIILSETGIDRGGGATTDGWQGSGGGRPLDAETYTTLLAQYALRLASRVPEVTVISPFTWLSTGWPSFDIPENVSARLLSKWTPTAEIVEPPTPTVPIEEQIREAAWADLSIPFDATKALTRYAHEHRLGIPYGDEVRTIADYVYQKFAGGIVYAREGDWGNVKETDW